MFKLKNVLLAGGVFLILLGIGIKIAQASCTLQYCSGLGNGSVNGYAVSIGLGESDFHVGSNMNVITTKGTETNLPVPWLIEINITTDNGQSTTNNGTGFHTFTVPTTVGTHILNFNGNFGVPSLNANNATYDYTWYYETGSITYTVLPGGGGTATPPTITSPYVIFVTPTDVGLQANVIGTGTINSTTPATITERGFCYFKQS